MPRTINIGQFYGGLIGAAFWTLAATWYLYISPRRLRRRIDCGDIDAFDGLAKIRKASLVGYMLLLVAIADAVGTLDYVGAFGSPWVAIVLQSAVVISMFFVVRGLIRESRVVR
jgi:hypothetical protein